MSPRSSHRPGWFGFAVVTALSGAPALSAQEHDAHHHVEGRLGRVDFRVSCTPDARRLFGHAMAALHSFWWEEGERAFGDVLSADSTCAMAEWGLAIDAWGNPFAGGPAGPGLAKGVAAAERASVLPAGTARERGLIAAVGALYRNATATTNAERLQAYADTMARVYRSSPGDVEVAIYHALAMVATAPRTDTTFAQQRRAIAILEPLFARRPDHPGLAHYLIHATDSPQLARFGLVAARRYALIAPAAPHAQHMPSHIFVRLGLWDETVSANRKSYRAGVAYAASAGLPGATREELHALDYAVYAYLQRGQDSAARGARSAAERITVADTRGVIGGYNRTALAARIPLERGEWGAAALIPVPADSSYPMAAALARFARAIGRARSGDAERARAEIAALDTIASSLDARKETYWARVVRIKRTAADTWVQFAGGDTAGALALATAAADTEEVTDKHPITPAELLPARELEADMLLEARRYGMARDAYRATLAVERGRARSTFGAARAADLAGDTAAAVTSYRQFLKLMEKADGGRREIAEARARLAPRARSKSPWPAR